MADIIRTAEELKDQRFNYFIYFKIDPSETDVPTIEKKIKQAMSNTGGSVESRRMLELKKDIEEIMFRDAVYDPANGTYKQNAGGRKKEAKAAKDMKLREAVEFVEMMAKSRNTLLRSELRAICKKANTPTEFYTEKELDAGIQYLVKQGTLKVLENEDSEIPFGKYKDIENLLKTLNKQDVYEFFGLARSTSFGELTKKMQEMITNPPKTGDIKVKQAMNKLISTCKDSVLANEQARRYYDQYMDLREDVWGQFEQRKSFGATELKMEEFCQYAQKAVDILKIKGAEAEKLIAIGCKHYQFSLVGSGAGNGLETCPYDDCSKLFVAGAKNCPHCGRPLEILCWNCQKPMAFTKDDRGCAACGATHRGQKEYTKKCGELDLLIGNPESDIASLQSSLLGLKNVVPDGAKLATSTLSKKVKEYEAIIAKRVQQEETLGAKYREEVQKIRECAALKQFQRACAMAKGLPRKYPNYQLDATKRIIAEMEAGVAKAVQLVEQAKRAILQKNEKVAVASAVQALELCEDYAEARQILQKFPPKPVTNVTAKFVGNKVYLDWVDNAMQDYVTYTVIKKIGAAPRTAEDGALADQNLTVKFYEDASIMPASPYYYAVYAERCGVKSAVTTTQTPIVVYPDVSSAKQELVYSGIKAVWDAPQNLTCVEVWKNKGSVAPLRQGEGTRVAADLKGFYDEKAEGENAYLIVCCYKTASGTNYSKGISLVAKPFQKTTALTGVKIETLDNDRFVFTCASGYTGKAELYYSNKALSIPLESTQQFLDFNSLCKGLVKIPTHRNAQGGLEFTLPHGKLYYIYPVVVNELLFAVSKPVVFNCFEGFKFENHKFLSGRLIVEGSMHPKATSLMVAVSHAGYTDDWESCKEKYVFKKEDFNKTGRFELQLKDNTLNYVTVFAEFKEDGLITYSPAEKSVPCVDYRQSVTVFYKLEYAASPVRPFTVKVSFEADEALTLDGLEIRQGYPPPRMPSDGQHTDMLPEIVLKKKLLGKKFVGQHSITVSPTARNTAFALFKTGGVSHIKLRKI